MQPKIQNRIQHADPVTPPVVESPPPKTLMEKPKVQPFQPDMARELEIMKEQNNLYVTIVQQEEQAVMQVNAIRQIIHDVRAGKVRMDKIHVMYGMGGYRQLSEENKKEFLQVYAKQLEIAENQLKALNLQRLHRADEVGEQRLKVMRQLWLILTKQNGFKDEELFEHCKTYSNGGTPFLRTENDIMATIQKAGDVIV